MRVISWLIPEGEERRRLIVECGGSSPVFRVRIPVPWTRPQTKKAAAISERWAKASAEKLDTHRPLTSCSPSIRAGLLWRRAKAVRSKDEGEGERARARCGRRTSE